MPIIISGWQIAGAAIFAAALIFYTWGWRRLRQAGMPLATWPRWIAFSGGILVLGMALIWPLPTWSNYLLTMRSLQKASICMIAAPLLWVGCPLHVTAWGTRGSLRTLLVTVQNSTTRLHRLVKTITQPIFTWFFFVGAFLLWHDPQAARFLLGDTWLHYVAPWLLLLASLLFWWPIVDTGPRLHRALPAWLLIVSLLGVEIANMVTGVTIAFTAEPVYAYYPALRAQFPHITLPLSPLHDQMAGGAIIWVFGSLVYIAGIIATLYKLFRREEINAPKPIANWDDHAKFIAPGLEHRVAENNLRNVDLSHR